MIEQATKERVEIPPRDSSAASKIEQATKERVEIPFDNYHQDQET